VDRAAWEAEAWAGRFGGYIAARRSWTLDDQKVTQLDLAVPSGNFDALLQAVEGLGVLIHENISSQPAGPPPGNLPAYSTIMVVLRPTPAAWESLPENGWSPARTFQRALGVFLAIFSFIADIVIWLVVVVGPFALAALLALWIYRHRRRRV
jgi:hypothetical protein